MSLEEGFNDPGTGFKWTSVSAAIGGIPEEGPTGSVRLEAMLFKDEAAEVCDDDDMVVGGNNTATSVGNICRRRVLRSNRQYFCHGLNGFEPCVHAHLSLHEAYLLTPPPIQVCHTLLLTIPPYHLPNSAEISFTPPIHVYHQFNMGEEDKEQAQRRRVPRWKPHAFRLYPGRIMKRASRRETVPGIGGEAMELTETTITSYTNTKNCFCVRTGDVRTSLGFFSPQYMNASDYSTRGRGNDVEFT